MSGVGFATASLMTSMVSLVSDVLGFWTVTLTSNGLFLSKTKSVESSREVQAVAPVLLVITAFCTPKPRTGLRFVASTWMPQKWTR